MSIPLTLLAASGSIRLVKRFTPEGTEPYPLAKRLTSIHYNTAATPQGLQERFALLQENARYGYALLKGTLLRPLENESRAGLTDNKALTQSIVLDIDGWDGSTVDVSARPLTSDHVRQAAEEVVRQLPAIFQNVSYIAHASASFGRKQKASVHIEFLLSEPVSARHMKTYIQHLNLTLPPFENGLRLTKAGHQLSWIIDPSVADNSHIVYIGAPVFDNVEDPFNGQLDDRWVLVEKGSPSVNLLLEMSKVERRSVEAAQALKIRQLRKAAGLPTHQAKTQQVSTIDRNTGNIITENVLVNPAACTVELYRITDKYAIFNIDGGDSNAYWCYLNQPDIIQNFKGEMPFLFSKADPEGYQSFVEQFSDKLDAATPTEIVIFRDEPSDTYYIGQYDKTQDTFVRNVKEQRSLFPVAKGNLEDAVASKGAICPDVVPSYTLHFNPSSTIVFDRRNAIVNQFELPPLMRGEADIPDEYKGLRYDYENRGRNNLGAFIQAQCPTIHKLIWHITGNNDECYEHFIHWLAFCAQYRKKSNTAWIFSGVPGTGKGLFMKKVVLPIWAEYATVKKQKNFEDKFNGDMERLLMIAVDEVHTGDSRNSSRLMDDLKHEISEEDSTTRGMFKEQNRAKFYTNFMFFSNHLDAVRIEAEDRRFNVCPPQMVSLSQALPEVLENIDEIDNEVPRFATMLMTFEANERIARTALDNIAKTRMRDAGMNRNELFFSHLKSGNLDYFIELILMRRPDSTDYTEVQRIATAKTIVSAWVHDAVYDETSRVPNDDLRLVYLALDPQTSVSAHKFGSMIQKNDVNVTRLVMDDGSRPRGVTTKWLINEYQEEAKKLVKPEDKKTFDPVVRH